MNNEYYVKKLLKMVWVELKFLKPLINCKFFVYLNIIVNNVYSAHMTPI